MRKFLSWHRLYPLIISYLLVVAARAFILVDERAPIDSALTASRREFGSILIWESLALSSGPALAASDPATSNLPLQSLVISAQETLPDGLLESRLSSNVMEPPPFGMESTDIFYPS
jgi:hypothetical protein